MKPPFLSIPDFVETHRPRHAPLENMQRLADPGDSFGAVDYAGIGTLADRPLRPDSLLEMYNGLPAVQQDSLARPEHYTARQQEIVAALHSGAACNPPATAAEKNELMLTCLRSTAADTKRKELVSRATAPDNYTLLDDGRTVAEATSDAATYENQKFDEEIVII